MTTEDGDDLKSKEKLFEEAFSQKAATLARKKAEYEQKLETARAKNPRIAEAESELGRLGAGLVATALSGDSEKLEALRLKMTALSDETAKLKSECGVEPIEYDCKKCSDTGYVSGKICDCIKNTVKQLRLKELSDEIPIDECRFDNFDLNYYSVKEDDGKVSPRKRMTNILKLCREYVLTFDPKTSANLLFMGGAGLGKTHLTVAMVSDLTKRGFDVIYSTAAGLFGTLENEHFNSRSTDAFDAILECDLLVIDDLGSEFGSPYTKSALYNIINSRILSSRPTVISTNLSMAEIEKLYSARIASRFIGEYTAKRFCGKDIRQLKAMEKSKNKTVRSINNE